ncbi:GlsB/YeaQ/YmgE family stress response membrane protein [Inquilinus sp. Marseille-Q2685]|uniref:GlsB/YeaQ/YmgE family stress response membrane protein n=1 Tax=Inquilinus sp. Marseille-Q2685 TaxID=2866581 RepID=UPI001CE43B93|nr:GlsB/YeaQ/YmgE family stress response membrane protein [Inquilinus sp. Marseille-Q2685]
MGIIGTIIIGFVIGLVAKFLMPGRDPGGFIITILLGIAGSVVGGWLGLQLGIVPESGFGRFLLGVVGAIVLLIIYRIIAGRSSSAG